MLRINGPEIEMEGPFGDLINEVARLVHTVAKAASEQFEKETEGEINYDNIVELVLEELLRLKTFDANPDDIPEEIMEDFKNELKEVRGSENGSESFIDYDSAKPAADAGSKIIQSVIKGVFADTRNGSLDIDDLKAINALKKKKKK